MDKNQVLMLAGATGVAFGFAVCAWANPQLAQLNRQTEANNPGFHKALLNAVNNYKVNYEELDDLSRIAPALCGTVAYKTPVSKLSSSDDNGTHGKKLYFLWLKDRDAYMSLQSDHQVAGSSEGNGKVSRIGQGIIKESWIPKSVPGDLPLGLGFLQPKLLPDKQGPLFVMLKTACETPGTDEGWIYGTLTPDGKTVLSSGRVQSCMGCHQAAPFDRLFGVKAAAVQ